MNGLEFTRQALWPGLLALPLVWFVAYYLFAGARRAAAAYGSSSQDAVPAPWTRATRLSLLLGLGWLVWMDPRYGEEQLQYERRGLDLVFCLDTSRSMLARDMEPSRLQRALSDIRAVLPLLQGGDRAGLVVFAGEARLWVPLTHDLDAFRGMLEEVSTDVVRKGGTDIAAALRKARDLVDADNAATTVVLLLTDGEDLAGAGRQAAAELAAAGLVVHTVGYGSAMGSKITVQENEREAFLRDRSGAEVVSRMDVDSLRNLAAVTGGEFLRAEVMVLPLLQLYQQRLLPLQKRSYDAGEETGKQARYQWVLLPLLLLLGLDILLQGGARR